MPWVNLKKFFNNSIGFQSWVLLLGCCLYQDRDTEYPRFLYSLNCFFLSDLHFFFLSSHILKGLFKLHLTFNIAFSSDSSVNLIDRTFCRANLIQKLSQINCIRLIRWFNARFRMKNIYNAKLKVTRWRLGRLRSRPTNCLRDIKTTN